ncbi:hypothetical protein [Actinacidiphila acidipaludis]|uniref:Uncharacterized protein n=1 Tax=Actinacidiphila acidipaludis TaxID=2873382 RepID=A0ABS7QEA0_9ACTN|nr:hypothetical protein [Streptomyces acidipaludis]MBY8881513.1 hypothetical protein [Streptomyces acidipaludis]
MASPELSETDYLREIERLAERVAVEAANAGWPGAPDGADDTSPLRRSVAALTRALRRYHFDGDGCLDPDRPPVRLVGACVLRPGVMPAGSEQGYAEVCARLGVEPRPEGWALWHTWADGALKVTMVVSAVDTTEGLLANWARGRAVDPVTPLPSQIALIHSGWVGPMTFSPRGVRRTGRGGRPLA